MTVAPRQHKTIHDETKNTFKLQVMADVDIK